MLDFTICCQQKKKSAVEYTHTVINEFSILAEKIKYCSYVTLRFPSLKFKNKKCWEISVTEAY